jgi:cytochrome c oxidase assembly factor CtaG
MTPLGLLAVAGAVVSLLAFWRRPTRRLRTTAQLGLALTSWGSLWFATGSSFAHDGMMSLPDHMIGHVLLMFGVPMGLVASGVARTWWWLLPVGPRRTLLRWWYVRRRLRVPTALASPLAAAFVLNAVMVAAHLPRLFDAVMLHEWSMQWGMEPAFLLSGLYFFHFLVPSWPRRIRTRLRYQLVMVLSTMLEMLVMAMAMSIFTQTSWYPVMRMPSMPDMPFMPGMGLSASQAFAQQQVAAAILWVCGDFWAVPCLVLIVRRLSQREGSFLALLDRQASRVSASG